MFFKNIFQHFSNSIQKFCKILKHFFKFSGGEFRERSREREHFRDDSEARHREHRSERGERRH